MWFIVFKKRICIQIGKNHPNRAHNTGPWTQYYDFGIYYNNAGVVASRLERFFKEENISVFKLPESNPTIASYNASVVNFYNATGSLARLENKKN
jgi:hypothetical protein